MVPVCSGYWELTNKQTTFCGHVCKKETTWVENDNMLHMGNYNLACLGEAVSFISSWKQDLIENRGSWKCSV